MSWGERCGEVFGVSSVFLLALLPSCMVTSPWVMVRSEMVGQSSPSEPEVVETDDYRRTVGSLRSVAVKAPDYCANEDVEAQGEVRTTGTVLSTACGLEMGEMERALAMAGYRVTSWTTLAQTARREEVTLDVAAARLGAEVLFQVNSLQRVKISPQIEYRWEREVLEMDKDGQQLTGKPAQTSKEENAYLYGEAAKYEQGADGKEVLGATLDVSAIMVATGQSIWFYRGTRFEEVSDSSRLEFRAMRNDGGGWFIDVPREPGTEAVPAAVGNVTTETVGATPADPDRQVYHQLMQELVRDFAERFAQGGEASGASPARPPSESSTPPAPPSE